MWFLALLAGPAEAASDSCESALRTEEVLVDTKEERRLAWREYHEPDWSTELALAPDRDVVLAEIEARRLSLQDARDAVRDARDEHRDAVKECAVEPQHAPIAE